MWEKTVFKIHFENRKCELTRALLMLFHLCNPAEMHATLIDPWDPLCLFISSDLDKECMKREMALVTKASFKLEGWLFGRLIYRHESGVSLTVIIENTKKSIKIINFIY